MNIIITGILTIKIKDIVKINKYVRITKCSIIYLLAQTYSEDLNTNEQ